MSTKPVVPVILILIALWGLSVPRSATAAEELFDNAAAQQHVAKGLDRLQTRDYDAAIAEFEQSVEIAPNAEAYYYLGYAYYLKGKSEKDGARSLRKSRENFDKAYEIDPQFTPRHELQAGPAPAQEAGPQEGPASAETVTNVPPATDSTGTQEPEQQPEAGGGVVTRQVVTGETGTQPEAEPKAAEQNGEAAQNPGPAPADQPASQETASAPAAPASAPAQTAE